jgi:hypothetical protein
LLFLQRNEKIPANSYFMGLNDMNLSAFLVENLYRNHLIENGINENLTLDEKNAKDEKNTTKTAQKSNLKYLGKNEQNILLLVNDGEHKFLGDEELTLLLNILGACNINMQHVALVNAAHYTAISSEEIEEVFAPKFLLFFGTEPQQFEYPLQIPMYKIQAYNSKKFLTAPDLNTLQQNKEEKKKLWLALKELFAI